MSNMATYQPTTTAFVIPGLPPYYQRPRIRLDCSFFGTKIGILKLLELIFTVIAFVVYQFQVEMFRLRYKGVESVLKDQISLGFLFYSLLPYTVGPAVNLLLWSYLFHIPERYNKIPWYTIEFVTCFGCCLYSLICGFHSYRVHRILTEDYNQSDRAYLLASIFSTFAAVTFVYNIIVVYDRRCKNIPPQVSEH